MMNKQKGNMYPWVTHTWNPIKGKCPHDCSYCYMKRFPQGDLRLDEKTLKDGLGKDNFIFVGSSCDMFANKVPDEWIKRVLTHCIANIENTYLLQTKNPQKMYWFYSHSWMGNNFIYGTTIETNRTTNISKAPNTIERAKYIEHFNGRTMVSIEPIMDFDLDIFVRWIKLIQPKFVSIGADSKGHNLPEPSADKVKALIKELKKFTEVKLKDNLARLTSHNNDFKAHKSSPKDCVCVCGHDLNFHDILDNYACHSMDCDCKRYQRKPS